MLANDRVLLFADVLYQLLKQQERKALDFFHQFLYITFLFSVVREIRYIREAPRPSPRIQRRVVYEQPRPARRPAPRQVVYVDSAPRRQERYTSSFSNRRPVERRTNDPFYEPRNFLQRLPGGRY